MGNEHGEWIMHGVRDGDPNCIRTAEQLIEYINEIGFLPLFKNDVPGFSVEEHTVSKYWWSDHAERDPWIWREIIARRGEIAYGKLFDKKAGFISKQWLPRFVNYRRDGYDYDARFDDGKATYRSKKIMDLFSDGGELYSFEAKEQAGFGKDGEKNFEGIVTELQMQTYLVVRDFRRRVNKAGKPYGWAVAVYTTPEALWGYDYVTSAYSESPERSGELIAERLRELFPEASERGINKILGKRG